MSGKEKVGDVQSNQTAGVAHAEVRAFYDDEYYADAGVVHPLSWHPRAIASRLGDLHGCRVLDIACGTGQWLMELQRRGAKPSGIDISARAVSICRRTLPDADIREGVAELLPFDADCFDLVTCLGSLEHFLDQPRALAEMRRVATSAARFLILVPNADFLTRRLGLYGGTRQATVRETVRSLDEWEAMLAAAGMSVRARWRDLHPLSSNWIQRGPALGWPVRAVQAVALAAWPIRWQYQVYFLCEAGD